MHDLCLDKICKKMGLVVTKPQALPICTPCTFLLNVPKCKKENLRTYLIADFIGVEAVFSTCELVFLISNSIFQNYFWRTQCPGISHPGLDRVYKACEIGQCVETRYFLYGLYRLSMRVILAQLGNLRFESSVCLSFQRLRASVGSKPWQFSKSISPY